MSPGSACSLGEWETPLRLRTKSIVVGTPASARIPASWPAAVGIGAVDVVPLVTRVVPLADAVSAGFEPLRRSRDEMKVLIRTGEPR